MSPLIYFLRHGQTDWNANFRFQGQEDVDINEKGREQAHANGRHLAQLLPDPSGFDFVASPMRRTRETMEIVRGEMGLPREGYRVDARLMEVNFGDWQRLTVAEVEKAFPGAIALREKDKWGFLPPGEHAESYVMLADRLRPWLHSVTQDTVCVTHGGIIRALLLEIGAATRAEAQVMEVPQDRILKLQDGKSTWL